MTNAVYNAMAAVGMELPAKVKQLIEKMVDNKIDLFKGYTKIGEDAKNGAHITSRNFLNLETGFAERNEGLTAALNQALAELPYEGGETVGAVNAYGKEVSKNKPGTTTLAQNLDIFSLNQAFVRDYIQNNTRNKNVSLPDSVTTEAGMLTEVLKNNRGAALADEHTQEDGWVFLSKNMNAIKKAGVDTIYCEHGIVRQLADWSLADLKTLKETRQHRNIRLDGPEKLNKAYGVENADDVLPAAVETMIKAKENGIRMVFLENETPAVVDQIESKGWSSSNADEKLATFKRRVARINFLHVDRVEADRAQMEKENPGGKFIIFNGSFHLFKIAHKDNILSGFVADALEVPTLAHYKADKSTSPAFTRRDNPNGADFYLPGGTDYPDTKSKVLNAALDPLKLLQKQPTKEGEQEPTKDGMIGPGSIPLEKSGNRHK